MNSNLSYKSSKHCLGVVSHLLVCMLFQRPLGMFIMIYFKPISFFINSFWFPLLFIFICIIQQSFVTSILKEQTMGKIIFTFYFFILTFQSQTKSLSNNFIVCCIFLFLTTIEDILWETEDTFYKRKRLFNIVRNQQATTVRWDRELQHISTLKCNTWVVTKIIFPCYYPITENICLETDGLHYRMRWN